MAVLARRPRAAEETDDVLLMTHLEINGRVNERFEIGVAVSTTHLRQSRLAARPASQLRPPTVMHHNRPGLEDRRRGLRLRRFLQP